MIFCFAVCQNWNAITMLTKHRKITIRHKNLYIRGTFSNLQIATHQHTLTHTHIDRTMNNERIWYSQSKTKIKQKRQSQLYMHCVDTIYNSMRLYLMLYWNEKQEKIKEKKTTARVQKDFVLFRKTSTLWTKYCVVHCKNSCVRFSIFGL